MSGGCREDEDEDEKEEEEEEEEFSGRCDCVER